MLLKPARHSCAATRTTAMPHIAVPESLNGTPVHWLEQASEEDYLDGLNAV